MEVALTFGSVGDIIALVQLSWQLRLMMQGGSAEEYQNLRKDLDDFVQILIAVIGTYEQRESSPWLSGLDQATKSAVHQCTSAINETLTRIHSEYGETLGADASSHCTGRVRAAYTKVKWCIKEKDRILALKELLKTSTQRLTLLVAAATQMTSRVDNETLIARMTRVEEELRKVRTQGEEMLRLQRHHEQRLEEVTSELQRQSRVGLVTLGSLQVLITAVYEVGNMVGQLHQTLISFRNSPNFRVLDPTQELDAILEDSLGKTIKISPDMIDYMDWDILNQILRNRFLGANGYRKVQSREYALEENVSGRDLDLRAPLSSCLRRGMKVNMTMLFYDDWSEETLLGSCPRCGRVAEAAEGKTVQCETVGCGMHFRLQIQRASPRVEIETEGVGTIETTSPAPEVVVEEVHIVPADFQRVRLLHFEITEADKTSVAEDMTNVEEISESQEYDNTKAPKPNTRKSPKSILKPPRASFPEETHPIREGVALRKWRRGIAPPSARWTKINRALINPEALRIGKERFEVRDDFVIVLRVLSKEEIDAYAAATAQLRQLREERRSGQLREEQMRGRALPEGTEGVEYSTPSDLVRYDLEHDRPSRAAPRRERRTSTGTRGERGTHDTM